MPVIFHQTNMSAALKIVLHGAFVVTRDDLDADSFASFGQTESQAADQAMVSEDAIPVMISCDWNGPNQEVPYDHFMEFKWENNILYSHLTTYANDDERRIWRYAIRECDLNLLRLNALPFDIETALKHMAPWGIFKRFVWYFTGRRRIKAKLNHIRTQTDNNNYYLKVIRKNNLT